MPMPQLLRAPMIEARYTGLGEHALRYQGTDIALTLESATKVEFLDVADRAVVLKLALPFPRNGHHAVSVDGATVGSIVPTTKQNWRGREVGIGWTRPTAWVGSIRLTGSEDDVASVRGGQIRSVETSDVVAELWHRAPGAFQNATSGVWTLRISESTTGPLRLMALGWLGLACAMQRTRDHVG